jgi:hypothetical protein
VNISVALVATIAICVNENKTTMTTIHISELPIDAQDNLRKTYHQYYINVDPVTNEQYVRFMGENVALSSIKQSQILLG